MSKHLTDMRRSKKERKQADAADAVGQSSFPYGLTLNLDDESLDKLGFKKLPTVGDRMVVAAIGRVESVSERTSERNKDRDVRIQLEKLDVSPVPARKAKTAEDAISEAIKDV